MNDNREPEPERIATHSARWKAKQHAADLRRAGRDAWHVLARDGFAVYATPEDDNHDAPRDYTLEALTGECPGCGQRSPYNERCPRCRDLERAPQGTQPALFTHVPQLAGQERLEI